MAIYLPEVTAFQDILSALQMFLIELEELLASGSKQFLYSVTSLYYPNSKFFLTPPRSPEDPLQGPEPLSQKAFQTPKPTSEELVQQ